MITTKKMSVYQWLICITCFVSGTLFPLSYTHASGRNSTNEVDDTTKLSTYFKLAMDLKLSDSAAAAGYANRILLLSEKAGFTRGQARAYYLMGRIAHDYNAHEKAVELLEKSVALSMKAHDPRGMMEGYYWIARCYRRIADYPEYKQYLSLLEKQAILLADKEYLSFAYEGYGNLYRYLADYPQSIHYYMKAIELSEELGNLEDVSRALNNMSLVYSYQGKSLEELKLQMRNYDILTRLGNKSELVLCLSNLSGIYDNMGLKNKSDEYIAKAIAIIEEDGQDNIPFKNVCAAYDQYADRAIEKGDYKKGLEYYSKNLKLRETNKDVKGISDAYGNLAIAYRLMGENDSADELLLMQLATSTKIGYVNGRMNAYGSLMELKVTQGDFKTAYLYQQEYMRIKDSMEIETNSKEMAKVDAWFQMRDQKQQIKLLLKDREMKEMELKKRNQLLYALGVGALLLLAIVLLVFNNYRKLKKAKMQLQAVNKELESFSYSVSHDLRAPLRAISGYASLLEDEYKDKLDEEGNRLMLAIQYNTKRMGQLIDDLLSFSKLGKKEIRKTTIDMKMLTEETLNELNKSVKHKAKIKIGDLHMAKGDQRLIEQVVVNLLSNSIKYSAKSDEPLIEIGSEKKGNEITYWFKDNGVGFDMHYAGKLFGVFQRLHPPQEFEGTGVGLAIVKRIVNKHGGKVWAEGERDKGAVFLFTLPLN